MLSYWEKKNFLDFDVIIVGAGLTGLSAALSLKEKAPGYQVAVLERGVLPAGASSRNAGFACIGSLTEILDDLEHMGTERVLELVGLRMKGLELLRKRLGKRQIGYQEDGSFELLASGGRALEQMEKINKLLFPVLGSDAFSDAGDRARTFGFDAAFIGGIIQNNLEGALNTGKMMKALRRKALAAGVEILSGCRVNKFREDSRYVIVETAALAGEQPWCFRASRVAVCTNAFTSLLLPDVMIRPARGQVLLTKPVKGLPFRGIFHFDKGYYYFRELDGRVLLGGGRNLDVRGETTTIPEVTDLIQQDLEEKLRTVILPGREVQIDQRWAGIMGFGADKFPEIRAYSQRIFVAAGMGGMGIAIGSEAGRQIASLILGNTDKPED